MSTAQTQTQTGDIPEDLHVYLTGGTAGDELKLRGKSTIEGGLDLRTFEGLNFKEKDTLNHFLQWVEESKAKFGEERLMNAVKKLIEDVQKKLESKTQDLSSVVHKAVEDFERDHQSLTKEIAQAMNVNFKVFQHHSINSASAESTLEHLMSRSWLVFTSFLHYLVTHLFPPHAGITLDEAMKKLQWGLQLLYLNVFVDVLESHGLEVPNELHKKIGDCQRNCSRLQDCGKCTHKTPGASHSQTGKQARVDQYSRVQNHRHNIPAGHGYGLVPHNHSPSLTADGSVEYRLRDGELPGGCAHLEPSINPNHGHHIDHCYEHGRIFCHGSDRNGDLSHDVDCSSGCGCIGTDEIDDTDYRNVDDDDDDDDCIFDEFSNYEEKPDRFGKQIISAMVQWIHSLKPTLKLLVKTYAKKREVSGSKYSSLLHDKKALAILDALKNVITKYEGIALDKDLADECKLDASGNNHSAQIDRLHKRLKAMITHELREEEKGMLDPGLQIGIEYPSETDIDTIVEDYTKELISLVQNLELYYLADERNDIEMDFKEGLKTVGKNFFEHAKSLTETTFDGIEGTFWHHLDPTSTFTQAFTEHKKMVATAETHFAEQYKNNMEVKYTGAPSTMAEVWRRRIARSSKGFVRKFKAWSLVTKDLAHSHEASVFARSQGHVS